MILLDENFPESERAVLRRHRLRPRKIGVDFLAKGYQDREIVDLLRRSRRTTFFSLDRDYYRRDWCHPRICLVFLDVPRRDEAAHYVRRLLRHPLFDVEARRLGCVIRVSPAGVTFWRLHQEHEQGAGWS